MSDDDRIRLALMTFPECRCVKEPGTSWELTIYGDRSVRLVCIRCWASFDFIDEQWVLS